MSRSPTRAFARFRKLTQHCPDGAVREADGVFAFATGIPFSLFNGCIVTEPIAGERVDEALEWVHGHGSPYRLWIVEELAGDLAHVPPRHGLELQPDPYPGMVLQPVPNAPAPAEGVEVVSDEGSAEEAVQVAVASGMGEDFARRLYSDFFANDPEVQIRRPTRRKAGRHVDLDPGRGSERHRRRRDAA